MTADSFISGDGAARPRGWVWAQLLIGWAPVWALYAAIIVFMHGGALHAALFAAARAIGAAALLGLVVMRLTRALPWPRPVTAKFVLLQTLAALAFALSWVALTSAIEWATQGRIRFGTPGLVMPFVVLGLWLYIALAGVTYAVRATEDAARARLVALRSQLNPHFLFNALHTVVQLIPVEPAQAAEAAEQLAGLLRTTIEEDRDQVPLREECAFAQRYLALEQIRFGDRLVTTFDVPEALADIPVPTFAVQTLVENAVRHGASPRVEPTRIAMRAELFGDRLRIVVEDSGDGADAQAVLDSPGTGLRRLRERLQALHGRAASLTVDTRPGCGFTAVIELPVPV